MAADLLAFAHKTDPVVDEDGHELDPLAEVRRQAAEVLGPEAASYRTVAQTSAQSVVRGTELRFVPSVPGAEFNPPEVAFRWQEPVHRSAFRVRADAAADGVVLEGRMAVFCGIVALAEIPLRLAVDATAAARRPEPEQVTARPYERIFPSYSHLDADVVTEVEAVSIYLRNQFMRDCRMLRAGEVWSARLREAIDEATVFQLFWSRNAMASQHVRDEWEYALSLGRDDFIRPVYWEWPIPRDDAAGLPPPALERLHFHPLRQPPPPPAAAPATARRRRWLRRSVGGGAAALAACALVLGVALGPLGGSGERPSPSSVPAEIGAFVAGRVPGECTPMPAITAREEGALTGTSCSPAGLDATLFVFPTPAAAERYLARLEATLEAAGGREVDCGSASAALARQRCFVTPDGDRYALYAGAGRPIAGVVRGPQNSPAWRLRVPSPVPAP